MKNEILEIVGTDPNGVETGRICHRLDRTPQDLGDVFERLLDDGALFGFAGLWLSPEGYAEGSERYLDALLKLHEAKPKAQTHDPAEVARQAGLKWSGKPLARLVARMEREGRLRQFDGGVRHAAQPLELNAKQRALLDRVIEQLKENFPNTPNPHQLGLLLSVPKQATAEILRLGVERGEIVDLGEGVFYLPEQMDRLIQMAREAAGGKPFSASEMRDALGTTRKYIGPLMVRLDELGITEIRDEARVFRD